MGNVLYNGVELLDVNTVWTDKTTYPYAHIYEANGIYGLVISTHPALFRTRGSYTADYLPTGAVCMQYAHAQTEWYYMSSKTISSTSGYAELNYAKGFKIIWASYDVYRSTDNEFTENDGSLYLAASKPVDPNAPAYTYDRTAFLSGMAMGLTGKGNPVSLQTTVKTMLYNGVELPELPEWDKTKYPYAFITFDDSWIDVVPGVTRHELVTADAAPVWGETYNGEPAPVLANCTYQYARVYNQLAQDIVVGEGGSKYDFPTNKEGWSKFKSDTLAEDHRLALDQAIWCNNTLLDGDGSVLLVASEPVPTSSSKANGDGYASPSLASEPTVEDSFTNGYKVGAALRRKRVIVSTEVLDNTVPITWNTAAVANNTKVVVDDIPFVRISSLYAENAADVYSNAGVLYMKPVGNDGLQAEMALYISQVVSPAEGVFLAVYAAGDDGLAVVSVPEDGMVIEGVTVPEKGIYVMDVYTLGMGEYELRLDAGDPPKVFFDNFPMDLKLTFPQLTALAGENEIPLYQEDGTQNGSLLKISNLTPTLDELNTLYNTVFAATSADGVTEVSNVETLTWRNAGTFVKNSDNDYWVVYETHTLHTTVFDNSSIALSAEVTPGIYLSDKTMFVLVLSLALLANASKNGTYNDDGLRMFLGTAEDAATALAEYDAIAET